MKKCENCKGNADVELRSKYLCGKCALKEMGFE